MGKTVKIFFQLEHAAELLLCTKSIAQKNRYVHLLEDCGVQVDDKSISVEKVVVRRHDCNYSRKG
jgi:hypothetical protein